MGKRDTNNPGGNVRGTDDRRSAPVHGPEGERGEGNPRQPQRDLQREGDVINPDVRQPNRAPDRPTGTQPDKPGHEADPPQPRKHEEREVPPYAGGKERSSPDRSSTRSDQR